MVAASVVMAFPFGWALGVLVAYLVAGADFGQLPALTVPLGIVAAIVFALRAPMAPRARLRIMVVGTLVFVALGWLVS